MITRSLQSEPIVLKPASDSCSKLPRGLRTCSSGAFSRISASIAADQRNATAVTTKTVCTFETARMTPPIAGPTK